MGGMKNQDFVAAPPKCMDSPNKRRTRRLYQVWKGRNKFICGGRLIIGPDSRSFVLTTFLIGGPALTFCTKMFLRTSTDVSFCEHAVLIVGLVLTFLDLSFLLMTSTRNPGIIPRNRKPPNVLENTSLDSFPSIEWIPNATPGPTLPRTKDVIVNGQTVKVKYCDTCLLYRPPRASHCSTCNNCIQRFDHHCPWLNQCIGVRNYGSFILFISTSTILCLYVFTFSLLALLKESGRTWRVLTGDVVLVVLMVYCFVAVWFVGGLTLFHYYLIITNQTTYENFRCLYGSKENPHNRGVMKNLKEILFSKTAPSLVNFREWVAEEEETFAESMNKRFGWDIPSSNNKIDLELGSNCKEGKSLPDFLHDFAPFEGSVKDRGTKTTTYDPFLLFNDQDETDSTADHPSVFYDDDLTQQTELQR